jgi:glycosyltransferase involved in cell wall biosynthesis
MARPIVATDVAGVRDVVEHRATGLLCTPRNAESLAEAMIAMIEIPSEARAAMGQAGRAKVERDFAISLVTDRYLDAIDRALKS